MALKGKTIASTTEKRQLALVKVDEIKVKVDEVKAKVDEMTLTRRSSSDGRQKG